MIQETDEGMSHVEMMRSWRTKCSADGGKTGSLCLCIASRPGGLGEHLGKFKKDAVISPKIFNAEI